MFAETLPPGSHRPRLAPGGKLRYSFPSSPPRDATRWWRPSRSAWRRDRECRVGTPS